MTDAHFGGSGDGLFARERATVAPGAVHIPDWLTPEYQKSIVEECGRWASGPVPARTPTLPGGRRMSVRQVCLGWHWAPYRYTRTAGGVPVLPLPRWLTELGRAAVVDAFGVGTRFEADAALVNFYDGGATMGMHQDKDEHTDAPVVSLSLGDACRFRFGNTVDRGRPYRDIELRSGDLFVFGGPSRLAYHGVPKVHPDTADPAIGIRTGRINITLRSTGLSSSATPTT